MKSLLLSIFALSLTLSAADFTGKWIGKYDLVTGDGDNQKGNVVLILTQAGSDLTGTVGVDEGQQTQIAKGHVDGDKITFESQGDGPVMHVVLHLEEDHLRGTAKGDDNGEVIEAKVDLTRKVAP